MSNELDIRDYFQTIRKRIWWIVCSVLIISIAVGVYSKFIKDPIFEASTKIIVNRSSETDSTNQLNSDVINTNIRLINTYKEIIKTPAILDKVIERHPEFGLTSDQLMKKIKVSSVNDTQVMTVMVDDPSYQQAAQIVNAVSDVFKQEIPELFNVQNVSILNQAKLDSNPSPVSPNVMMNVIIAFIVSLMIAVGIAFLMEYLDDTVKSEADIESVLGLPTLAAITRMNPEEIRASAERSATTIQAGEVSHVSVSK